MNMKDDRQPLESAEVSAAKLGRILKEQMPKGWHFFLLLATAGENGVATYLADIERSCAIKMLREMADHLESKGKEI